MPTTLASTLENDMVATAKRTQRKPMRRLTAYVSPELMDAVRSAAAASGKTVNAFLVETVQERAEAELRDRQVIVLSERDSALLVEALLNPPAPSLRTIEAARRYRELVGSPGE